MVMRNGVRSWGEQWLDLNTDETFAHSLLLGAFTFSNTPEGHMFWYNLKDKLKAKNL
jgi:predicted metal-binding protein